MHKTPSGVRQRNQTCQQDGTGSFTYTFVRLPVWVIMRNTSSLQIGWMANLVITEPAEPQGHWHQHLPCTKSIKSNQNSTELDSTKSPHFPFGRLLELARNKQAVVSDQAPTSWYDMGREGMCSALLLAGFTFGHFGRPLWTKSIGFDL